MWVCVKLDVENAHNAMARVAILETVETEQSLRHLTLHYAATSASPTALESGGQVWEEGEEGLTQGRPGSSGNTDPPSSSPPPPILTSASQLSNVRV